MGLLDDIARGITGGRRKIVDKRGGGHLDEWAKKHNWTYVRRDDNWADHFAGLPHVDNSENDGKQAREIMRGGHRNRMVTAMHYFCEHKEKDSSGRERSEFHKYIVVSILLPKERPTLTITTELWQKLRDLDLKKIELRNLWDNVRDLKLESIDFNKQFNVQIKRQYEKFAYDVLHPRMMEHLLADKRATERKWPIRFERADLYTWDQWEAGLDMRAVMNRADYLIDILERIPDFVWKD